MMRILLPALLGIGLLVLGVFLLLGEDPNRVVVTVNNHELTSLELDQRADLFGEDYLKVKNVRPKPGHEDELMRLFRFEAAKRWVMKEIFLDEAIRRGLQVTKKDEEASVKSTEKSLAQHGLTMEQYLKMGPLSKERKEEDMREVMLIGKLIKTDVDEKINVEPAAVDEMQKKLSAEGKLKDKNGAEARKAAMRSVMLAQRAAGIRKLFKGLYEKATVASADFPELEKLETDTLPLPGCEEASVK